MKITRKATQENNGTQVNTIPAIGESLTTVERKVSPMNTNKAIEFVAVARSNERCLVYDIRQAIAVQDTGKLASLVKAWLNMVNHEVPQDAFVIRFVSELLKVAYTGKDASCKQSEKKNPRLELLSQGRVKAWLYTINREKAMLKVVDTMPAERPAEKAVKAPKAKKATVPADLMSEFMAWYEMKQKAEKQAQ